MRICLALRAKIEASSAADPRTLTCKEVGKQYIKSPRNALNAHVERSRRKLTSKASLVGERNLPERQFTAFTAMQSSYLEGSPTRPLTSNARLVGLRRGPTLWACVVGLPQGPTLWACVVGLPQGPTSRAGVVGSSLWGLVLVRSLVSIWFYISNKCVEKNNYNKC